MNITQRQVTFITLGFQLAAIVIFWLSNILAGQFTDPLTVGAEIGILIYGILLIAHWRGWEYARYISIILITLLLAIVLPEPFVTTYAPANILLGPILALILAGPLWVVGSAVATIAVLLLRAGGIGVYADLTTILTYAMLISGLIASRLIVEASYRRAEASRLQVEQSEEALRKAHNTLEKQIQERTATLAQANTLLQTLMDHIPDHIFFKDVEGRFIKNSKSQAKMLGLSDPTQAIGKTDFDFFPHAQQSFDEEQEVIRSGQPLIDIEEYVVWPDKHTTWVSTTKVPFRDGNGQIIGTFGVARDITDRKHAEVALQKAKDELEIKVTERTTELRKANDQLQLELHEREQAEEALHESELKYRILVEQIPNAVTYIDDIDADIATLYISPQIEKMLGYSPEEWIANPLSWSERLHPEDRKRILAENERHKMTGEYFSQEYRLLARNGYEVWIHDESIMIRSEAGQPKFSHGIMSDITERKLAEDALAASEAELRTLLASMQDVVLVIDHEGVYRKIAPTNPDLLIRPPQELLGKNLRDIFPSEQADIFIRSIQQVLATQKTVQIEYTLPIEGQQRWFSTSISLMTEDSTLWVARDVTERKRVEEKIRDAEAKYRNLVEQMPVALYLDNPDDTSSSVYISPQIETLLGYSSAEFIDDPDLWHKLIHDEDYERAIATTKYTLTDGHAVDEYRMKARNGHTVWVRDTSLLIRNTDGQPLYIQGFMEDITKRKQAEQVQAALYEIANVAQTTLSINDLFASIHKTLGTFMPAENFYIAIYDIQNDLLSFPYFVDQSEEAPLPQKPGNGLTEYVLRTQQSLLATPQVFEEMINSKQVDSVGVVSVDWIGVPLTVGDETFGVMAVQTYTDKIRLTKKDLELLTFVSTQAAMVIKRKQAEEVLHQRTSQLEALREIGLELTAELDVDKLLHSITSHALDLLHSTGGGIYLHRPQQKKLELVVSTGRHVIPRGNLLERGEGLSGKVWEQRKAIIVDDYEHWEGRAGFLEGRPFKAVIGVPIIKGDEFLGVLVLLADLPGSFNIQDASLLELFAGYAAVAIHNARLYQNARQRLIELEVLYKTSNVLSAEHDLNTLLRSIVENAREMLNTATSGMYLCIPGSDELELSMDTTSYIPLGSRIHLGEGVTGRVAQTRQPIRIDDYSTWEGRSPQYEGISIRAVLEVPMLYRGKLIGVLSADEATESERKFTEEDEHLLSLFASQAAGAIHSARLFEETRRRAEEFAGLYQTTRDLSIQQDLSTVLTIITRQAIALLNVSNASITLYDPVRADLELVASIGPDLPIGTRRKIGDGLAGRVAQTHAPIIIEDYQNWKHRSPLYAAIPYTAMMGVPLLYSGNLLGVLDVSDVTPSTRTFSEADVRLLSLFAGQAASAIANARLFEETVRRLENLQSLRTIDDAISGSADVNLILEVILSQVISQLGADAAVILLFDPAEQILEYAAGRGFRTQALQHTRLTLGEGYAGRVAQERKTKHIPDIRAYNTDFLRSPTLSQEGFISYYGVPLITKGEVKGVLEVFHRTPFEAENDWLNFLEMLSGQTAIAIDNTALYKGLQLSNIELTLAYDATIEGWSRALDLRDKETEGHTQRVTEITINLAKAMRFSEDDLVNIRRGALLHDIGKMGVPDSILLKSGELTSEEWDIMHKHPIYAYEMLTPIAYLKTALDIPYCHHEKWDGTGYPRGLKGDDIPPAARIFAIVDVWDAIRSNRPYRQGWNREKAIEYIKSQSGTHFDPNVVKVFLKLIDEQKGNLHDPIP